MQDTQKQNKKRESMAGRDGKHEIISTYKATQLETTHTHRLTHSGGNNMRGAATAR